MPTRKHNNTCFETYQYSAGTQHGNLHQSSGTTSRETYFILRAHPGTGGKPKLIQEKRERGFGKHAGERTGSVEISSREKPLAVGEARKAIFSPIPGFIGRNFELWVLIRWVLDFCVRSTQLRGESQRKKWSMPLPGYVRCRTNHHRKLHSQCQWLACRGTNRHGPFPWNSHEVWSPR